MQYLYLIKCQQFYKIGVANDVESRLAQLSTGNPFELNVWAVYGFANAEFVERALHQRFADFRVRGEWFILGESDVEDFNEICGLLGGKSDVPGNLATINEEELAEAEELAEPAFGAKWDYAAMFADGWFMELGNPKKGDWRWRRDHKKQFLYGGLLRDLPYPISDMRIIYRDGGEPLNPPNKSASEDGEE